MRAGTDELAAPAGAAVRPGPPWIGPMMPRARYERRWLAVHVAMLVAAMVFFGWRGLVLVAGTAAVAVFAFTLAMIVLRLVHQTWSPAGSGFLYALNMGLLMGLTMPLAPGPWQAVLAALLVGVLAHFTGPTRRLRLHPVAVVHLLLFLMIPFFGQREGEAVLAPDYVVVGDVMASDEPVGGPIWLTMHAPPPAQALERNAPQRVMLDEQRQVLSDPGRLAVLLRGRELPRLVDVVLGAVPGPVGATSTGLLIVLGLFLMVQRIGRYPVAVLAVGAALAALAVMPVAGPEGEVRVAAALLAEAGWRVAVAYLGYQLLASPLLLVVLILAPLAMPRSAWGRAIYAVVIGGGVVTVRWLIPFEGAEYLPLIAGGLLCPVLDRLRRSPFVTRSRG